MFTLAAMMALSEAKRKRVVCGTHLQGESGDVDMQQQAMMFHQTFNQELFGKKKRVSSHWGRQLLRIERKEQLGSHGRHGGKMW
jgi:hypothetical protein